ncbi:MAG: UDP-N-acetylmuramoyl-tripeptide--D-alanyl-D-alanine ligase [Bacteroidaceae bacterium]|nr:UDP-N-acetylmuramoyl-tripeptide--D-alanyl-D-alanine ligase [Bacteroidaceae bacterium]
MNTEQLYKVYLRHPEVTTDSRHCPEGGMFFALRGENFDGNKYALSALDQGCAVAVVDREETIPAGDSRFILVDDVLQTMQELAAMHRRRCDIPVVQVTGTNGKTTTKELLAAVLSRKFNVLYTQGNLNNHIGVPLTLLRLRPEHETAVVETGANHPGEIAFLCGMVQADCGLITNVGRAHLEGFGSFAGVKRTKGELYDDLKKRGALAFLNTSDADLSAMAEERKLKTVPYVRGEVADCNPMLRVHWYCDADGSRHTVQTNLIGAYNLANVLAAITAGLHFGVQPKEIDNAIEAYRPTNSRSEFRKTAYNRLIVDAYNANPTSMEAALDNFRLVQAENKMVILGEMRELGTDSAAEHQRIVDMLSTMPLNEIWLVGKEFARCDSSAITVPLSLFDTVEQVSERLSASHPSGHTILIKGSNGTGLFRLPPML